MRLIPWLLKGRPTILCKDCKHNSEFYCGRVLTKPDLVDGRTKRTYCLTARLFSFGCGPNAKLYEPKVPF